MLMKYSQTHVSTEVCPSTWSRQRKSFTVDRSPKIGLKNFNGLQQMGANWSEVEVRIGGGKQMDCRKSHVSERHAEKDRHYSN